MSAAHATRRAQEVLHAVRPIPVDFGGGCSDEKALLLAALVHRAPVRRSIDVGVYRGRSLIPLAVAHRRAGGHVLGIDPFSVQEAYQEDRPDMLEALEAWRHGIDPDALYADVQQRLVDLDLGESAVLVRKPSREVWPTLADGSAGVIHVDGNHDRTPATHDMIEAARVVAGGGFVVVDDPSWASVEAARREALVPLSEVLRVQDERNDFAVHVMPAPGVAVEDVVAWVNTAWRGALRRIAREP